MRFIFLFVSLSLYTVLVYAHPPTRVDISRNGSIIEIVATHRVPNPQQHYIDVIKVYLNGKTIIEQKFSLQTDNIQKAVYSIPELKSGDTIEAEAECNQYGELKQTLAIK